MIKILFVDDEPNLLSGLRRILFSRRDEWQMRFAEGGEAALETLREEPADVIVSDMRMPGMDGATLLGLVREEFPYTVRIVLSGHSELTATLRMVPLAHQFLNKPCQVDELCAAVDRSVELQRRLQNPQLRGMLCDIQALPSPMNVIEQLNEIVMKPNPPLELIESVISSDVAITARVLQVANSAFFGISKPVVDIREAVSTLGIGTLRNLVCVAGVFDSYDVSAKQPGFESFEQDFQKFESHCVEVGRVAGALTHSTVESRDASVAGLLHDVGLLAMATGMPEQFKELRDRAYTENRELHEIEQEVLGATHADLGAELVRLWGLPYSIVEPIARHHDAPLIDVRTLDAVQAVYIAQSIVSERSEGSGWQLPPKEKLDPDYLSELGVTSDLSLL